METILLVIVILVILIAGYIAVTYNNLVMRRNRTQEAWSDIDVQLKRRYDLIPNLVETVKGYAAHESGTFEKVVQARNAAMAAQGTKEKAQAENVLGNTLKTLFAVAEAYTRLKSLSKISFNYKWNCATQKIKFRLRVDFITAMF